MTNLKKKIVKIIKRQKLSPEKMMTENQIKMKEKKTEKQQNLNKKKITNSRKKIVKIIKN